MLFNSWVFLVFFVLFFGAYWLLRGRLSLQNLLVLAGSYLFYGWWDIRFLALIIISTAIDYATAQIIDHGRLSRRDRIWLAAFVNGAAAACFAAFGGPWFFETGIPALAALLSVTLVLLVVYPLVVRLPMPTLRRVALWTSLAGNLGMLAIFKYYDFFAISFAEMWQSLTGAHPGDLTLDLILPVGISFYTFQTMSYTIDVYRGKMPSTRDPVAFASYVAFFPQLVAGPIERAKDLLPQFLTHRRFPGPEGIRSALWLIGWGLYKKLVIADNMARIVEQVFGPYDLAPNLAGRPDGLTFLVAIYAFALQIYCDFSGYTDIARGTARLLGFDLSRNFNLPYFAISPSDFWRRWHISLSSWLRDYLYIPLGGNQKGRVRTYLNLMITMVLGGLWHGASWTFVLWGIYHGMLLSIYRMLGIGVEENRGPLSARRLGSALLMWLVMLHLTCFGWLLFRAQNVETVWIFSRDIVLSPHASIETRSLFSELLKYSWFLVVFQLVQLRWGLEPLRNTHWFLRLNVWIFIFVSLLRLSAPAGSEFIYFAF